MTSSMPPFIEAGREDALAKFRHKLSDTLSGHPNLLLIKGEAGIGKSTIVREFCKISQHTDETIVISWGQCLSQFSDPYLPFKEILALLTGDIEGDLAGRLVNSTNAKRLRNVAITTAEILVEIGGDLIGLFVPAAALLSRIVALTAKAMNIGWISKLKKSAETPATHEGFKAEQFFEQFSKVLMKLTAKAPLIIVLDDLHWADTGSLELLFYIANRIRGNANTPLMIIGTFRLTEILIEKDGKRHPLARIINELRRYWGDIEFDLDKQLLNASHGLEFINRLVDTEANKLDAAFRRLLHDRTNGHPLFTVEILRMLEDKSILIKNQNNEWTISRAITLEDLPEKVEAVIEERVNRLEKELKNILTCGSIEGERFTAEIIARVRKIEELHLSEELSEELEKRHLLVISAGEDDVQKIRIHRYRFIHSLFQQYIYNSLSKMQRQQLHKAVGETLESLYEDRANEIAPQLARHFDEAHIYEKAMLYFCLAADQAKAAYANEDAIRYYKRAGEIAEQSTMNDSDKQLYITSSLLQIYDITGKREQQLEEISKLAEMVKETSDNNYLLELGIHQAKYYLQTGNFKQARETGDSAIDLARKNKELNREVTAILLTAEALALLSEFDKSLEYLQLIIGDATKQNNLSNLATAYRLISLVHLQTNNYVAALKFAEEALNLYRQTADRVGENETLRYIGDIYCGQGDYQKGLELYENVLRIRREIGNRAREGGAIGDIGDVYMFVGEYQTSLDLHEQSLKINLEVDYKYGQTWCHHDMGVIYFGLGDLVKARIELEKAIELSEEIRAQDLTVLSKNDLAKILIFEGGKENAAKALALSEEAVEIAKGAHLMYGEISAFSNQALSYLLLGEKTKAKEASILAIELLSRQKYGDILPEEILLNHSRVLNAVGEVEEAKKWLQDSYQEITLKAAKIKDEQLRSSFLEKVPLNKEIIQETKRNKLL